MQLGEYLKTLPESQTVAVGTVGGSGWVYIGTLDDLNNIVTSFASIFRNAKRELERDEQFLNSGRAESKNSIAKVTHRIEHHKAYLDGYLPALKRDIQRVYNRFTDNSIAIVIDGREYGYWDKEEYENRYRQTKVRYKL
jgi:hypothetical protein